MSRILYVELRTGRFLRFRLLSISQVRIANQNGLPFLATGGAHGAGVGFSNVENAVDIDLGNFNTTKLDVETGILTIGPGVVFSDIYDPLYNAGKEIRRQ